MNYLVLASRMEIISATLGPFTPPFRCLQKRSSYRGHLPPISGGLRSAMTGAVKVVTHDGRAAPGAARFTAGGSPVLRRSRRPASRQGFS
jgi:hypothetical protein